MKWALLFFLGGSGAVIVAACIVFLLLRHRLLRAHRVHHPIDTEAPLSWLVDPRQAARLHRRLAKVGHAANAIADDHRPPSKRFRRVEEPPPLVQLAEELRDQAVALDRQLARLSMLAPAARRMPLASLERSVDEVERAAARLVALSTEVRTPRTLALDDPGLLDVAGQIDRLAEAHQALLDLDAEAGLVTRPQPAPPLTRREPGR